MCRKATATVHLLAAAAVLSACGRSYEGRGFPIKQDGKYGFVDSTGRAIVKPQFDRFDDWAHEGWHLVWRDGKAGAIDTSGRVALEPMYEDIRYEGAGSKLVKKDGKWGCVNEKWEDVIEPQYDEIGALSLGRRAVKRDKTWGYVNEKWDLVIEPQFDGATRFWGVSHTVAGVCWGCSTATEQGEFAGGAWGIIDTTGSVVARLPWDIRTVVPVAWSPGVSVTAPYHWGWWVLTRGGWGLVDSAGQIIFPPLFNEIVGQLNNLVLVRKGQLIGIVDVKGRIVIEPRYRDVWNPSKDTKFGWDFSPVMSWAYFPVSGYEGRGWMLGQLQDRTWDVVDEEGAVLTVGLKYVESVTQDGRWVSRKWVDARGRDIVSAIDPNMAYTLAGAQAVRAELDSALVSDSASREKSAQDEMARLMASLVNLPELGWTGDTATYALEDGSGLRRPYDRVENTGRGLRKVWKYAEWGEDEWGYVNREGNLVWSPGR